MKRAPRSAAALACPNCGAPACEDSRECRYCGSELLTSLCTACRARVFRGHRHCPQCGASVAQPEVIEIREAWVCPRCAKPLRAIRHAGETLDECTSCGGFWVLKGVFEAISRDQHKRAAALGLPGRTGKVGDPTEELKRHGLRYVRCPVCNEQMARHNFARRSGVIVDVCRAHGVWFDPDEIQAILRFIQEGGMDPRRSGGVKAELKPDVAGRLARAKMPPIRPDESSTLPLWLETVFELVSALLLTPRRGRWRW